MSVFYLFIARRCRSMSDWENSFAYWIIRHSEQKFNYYAREIIINDSQAAQHLADELLVADSDHQ
jgi:hypothetical protein